MAKMEHLTDVTIDDLHQCLETIDQKTPALRLVAAVAYKNGITQSELAEWFDVERKTIYNWLTRVEEGSLDDAIRDAHRTGRPRKLSEKQVEELESILDNSPKAIGLDVPAWTTKLLQEVIRDKFGIEYSRSSCRRLMKGAGLSYHPRRRAAAEVDPEHRKAFENGANKLGHVWLPT